MRNVVFYFFLLFFAFFLASCTNPEGKFKEAEKINTIEAYQKFVQEFPNSEFTEEANKRIHKMSYEITRNENTEESYLRYANEYPQSEFAEESRNKADSLAYEKAISENTEESYLQFIEKYPNSEKMQEVKDKAANLRYEKVKRENTEEAFQNFITDYPESEKVKEVKKKLEEIIILNTIWNDLISNKNGKYCFGNSEVSKYGYNHWASIKFSLQNKNIIGEYSGILKYKNGSIAAFKEEFKGNLTGHKIQARLVKTEESLDMVLKNRTLSCVNFLTKNTFIFNIELCKD